MQEDNNTDKLHDHALDYESWAIAFEAYEHDPDSAMMMGFNIMMMKAFLLAEPPMLAEVIEGLDKAMEVLFPHSHFHRMAYEMFRRAAGGKLSFEDEQMLRALGLKF